MIKLVLLQQEHGHVFSLMITTHMIYSQSPQHYFICTLQHTDQASYACNKVDMLEQFLTKLLGDTEAHNCSNIVYTMLLP